MPKYWAGRPFTAAGQAAPSPLSPSFTALLCCCYVPDFHSALPRPSALSIQGGAGSFALAASSANQEPAGLTWRLLIGQRRNIANHLTPRAALLTAASPRPSRRIGYSCDSCMGGECGAALLNSLSRSRWSGLAIAGAPPASRAAGVMGRASCPLARRSTPAPVGLHAGTAAPAGSSLQPRPPSCDRHRGSVPSLLQYQDRRAAWSISPSLMLPHSTRRMAKGTARLRPCVSSSWVQLRRLTDAIDACSGASPRDA